MLTFADSVVLSVNGRGRMTAERVGLAVSRISMGMGRGRTADGYARLGLACAPKLTARGRGTACAAPLGLADTPNATPWGFGSALAQALGAADRPNETGIGLMPVLPFGDAARPNAIAIGATVATATAATLAASLIETGIGAAVMPENAGPGASAVSTCPPPVSSRRPSPVSRYFVMRASPPLRRMPARPTGRAARRWLRGARAPPRSRLERAR